MVAGADRLLGTRLGGGHADFLPCWIRRQRIAVDGVDARQSPRQGGDAVCSAAGLPGYHCAGGAGDMNRLRLVYALLALAGAVVPLYLHARWLMANGWDFAGLLLAWTANHAAAGAMADVVIAAITLIVWVLVECGLRRQWAGLWAILATCLIGPSCALPLYLLLRGVSADPKMNG